MSQLGKYFSLNAVAETLTGNTGGAISPTSNNINILGTGAVSVAGDAATSTLTISVSGAVPTTFTTDAGNAVPNTGVLDIVGGGTTNINTSGATNVVTVALVNSPSIVANLNMPNTTAAYAAGTIEFNSVPWISNYGTNNTFVGAIAGNASLTTANAVRNTGIGGSSLSGLTTGASNSMLGWASGAFITTGSANTAAGTASLSVLTTGVNNTSLGNFSLSGLLTGSSNIAIGYHAGFDYVGAESDNILIGNDGVAAESAVIRIGTNATHTSCFVQGIASVAVTNTNMVTINTVTGQMGSQALPATGIVWTVTTVNAGLAPDNGYIANKAGLLTMTLPALAAVGDTYRITNINTAVGWQVAQNAGQSIRYGTSTSTSGAGGYLQATALVDTAEIVCVATNTNFQVISSIGNLTVT